jgi:transcriptional regulator with XRE-family HTH domain
VGVDLHYGERLRKIREKGNLSGNEVGGWENISRQGISNRENKEDPVMRLSAIGRLLEETKTDARYLFGQINDIALADLRVADASQNFSELLEEYKKLKKDNGSSISQRVEEDPQLKECVKMLIKNRSSIGRVMGYLDRLSEEQHQKGEAAAG